MNDYKTAQAQQAYAALVERIRSRKDLSPEGMKSHLAAAYTEHKSNLKKLRDAEAAERDERRDQIIRRVFGGGRSDVLAKRDAAARASEVRTPEQARALLRQAHTTGDESLAAAVASRAYELVGPAIGASKDVWAGLVDEWATEAGVGGLLGELREIDNIGPTRGQTLTRKFDQMMRNSVSRPAELERETNLDGLAKDAGDGMTDQGRKAAGDLAVTFRGAPSSGPGSI